MRNIYLRPLQHRDELQIGVFFQYSEEVKEHLRKLKDVKWSSTHQCFYLPFSLENKGRLFVHFREKGWFVDYSALPVEEKRKQEQDEKTVVAIENAQAGKLMTAYVNYLSGKRYSQSTIDTYSNFVRQFIEFQQKAPEELSLRDVELFVEKNIAGKSYSISSHRQCISALVHFFRLFRSEEIDPDKLERPEKSKYLPTVLSKEEVIDLLRVTRNLKHRAILALIYSSGLRIGELLKLQLKDIDIDRRQIKVEMAKGRKDRYVVMAESFIPLLLNYVSTYRPERFFVEGLKGGTYTASAVRSFLKDSCARAGITKRVTPHCLRHSYATHMLENGIDIRYIQALLGHSRPETTMIYTHVAQKDLSKIKSPLDIAVKELKEQGKEDPSLRLSRKFLE